MRIKKCRICHNPLQTIISLGNMPMVNYYLSKEELQKPEKKYALTLCVCQHCTLVQLNELIPPQDIFVQYHYASSVSHPLKKHLEHLADLARKRFNLNKNVSALDIGCNDGVLLSQLQKNGIHVMGIDPAKNIVEKLTHKKIPFVADFFTLELAKQLYKKGKTFHAIFSTNTLAQVIDLDNFVKGIKVLLQENGVFIAEVGYVLDMIKKKTFDAMYHEHYSYFSLQSLQYLFQKYGLVIFDAQHISNHGGSLRIFVQHENYKRRKLSQRLYKILEDEKAYHLEERSSYKDFITYCKRFAHNFRKKLLQIKRKNKSIIGVTSPAKGVILLNYCHLDNTIIDYIVDSTPEKQYRFMPGVHIPVLPEYELTKKNADYLLILAWNYQDALLKKLEPYRKKGASVIIPFPRLKIISK